MRIRDVKLDTKLATEFLSNHPQLRLRELQRIYVAAGWLSVLISNEGRIVDDWYGIFTKPVKQQFDR